VLVVYSVLQPRQSWGNARKCAKSKAKGKKGTSLGRGLALGLGGLTPSRCHILILVGPKSPIIIICSHSPHILPTFSIIPYSSYLTCTEVDTKWMYHVRSSCLYFRAKVLWCVRSPWPTSLLWDHRTWGRAKMFQDPVGSSRKPTLPPSPSSCFNPGT
jgi:hypothetical protein